MVSRRETLTTKADLVKLIEGGVDLVDIVNSLSDVEFDNHIEGAAVGQGKANRAQKVFRFRQAQELLRKYNYVYDGVHTMISLAASFFCLRDSAHTHLTPSASN